MFDLSEPRREEIKFSDFESFLSSVMDGKEDEASEAEHGSSLHSPPQRVDFLLFLFSFVSGEFEIFISLP